VIFSDIKTLEPTTTLVVAVNSKVVGLAPGADFSYIFSGEIFRENSAENFPPKNIEKNGIFSGKSFEKSFFQEIPRNFLRKVIFRGKNVRKIGP
jgi:hypothetical protein